MMRFAMAKAAEKGCYKLVLSSNANACGRMNSTRSSASAAMASVSMHVDLGPRVRRRPETRRQRGGAMTGAAQLLGRTGAPSPLGGSSCPGLSRASTRIGLTLHIRARAVGAAWMAGIGFCRLPQVMTKVGKHPTLVTSPAMTSGEVTLGVHIRQSLPPCGGGLGGG